MHMHLQQTACRPAMRLSALRPVTAFLLFGAAMAVRKQCHITAALLHTAFSHSCTTRHLKALTRRFCRVGHACRSDTRVRPSDTSYYLMAHQHMTVRPK